MTYDILIGFGEVGQALESVLRERRIVFVHDPYQERWATPDAERPEWLHIAIPFSDDFFQTILEYVKKFAPQRIMVHSTVKIGTTRRVADMVEQPVVYSPIRGRHPNLARGIREFPKYYAVGVGGQIDQEVRDYFAAAGMQVRKAPSYETLEWMKLQETTTFGAVLAIWQEIEEEANRLPGGLVQNLNALKQWLFEKRKVYDGDIGFFPIIDLVPGPTGGHCIGPNWELLRPWMSEEFYDWLTKTNERRHR